MFSVSYDRTVTARVVQAAESANCLSHAGRNFVDLAVPLDNNLCEQALKMAARDRKNSLKHLVREWNGLKSIGQAITVTDCGEEHTSEVRYYVSSRPARVGEFATSVREHWAIESMHWVLDVVLGEDASRLRNGDACSNGTLREGS